MCALHIPTVPYLPYRSGHCTPERRLLERRPSRPHERFLPVRVPHWSLHSVSPGVSGDSLSEGSEHPPRHVWQVPEIDIACISHSGLCGVPCRIEPASRWWACISTSGLNKLAQGMCSSEVRKRRSPVLRRILQPSPPSYSPECPPTASSHECAYWSWLLGFATAWDLCSASLPAERMATRVPEQSSDASCASGV